MPPQLDLAEHLGTLLVLIGGLWTALLACLIYIFSGMKAEVKEIKIEMIKLSDTFGARISKVEYSLANLWGEHKATHENSHRRATDTLDYDE